MIMSSPQWRPRRPSAACRPSSKVRRRWRLGHRRLVVQQPWSADLWSQIQGYQRRPENGRHTVLSDVTIDLFDHNNVTNCEEQDDLEWDLPDLGRRSHVFPSRGGISCRYKWRRQQECLDVVQSG